MLNNNVVIGVIDVSESQISQVSELYRQLNMIQAEMGMSITLVDGGEKVWADSMCRLLGKYSQIVIASDAGDIVGFSAGIIKVMPPYYGSIIVGFWDSMYIKPDYRKMGIGDEMTKLLFEWWRDRGAVVVEGERLVVNENAKGNYDRLGFHAEVIKYRKVIEK